MLIGATIHLNGSRYQLLSADEFTTNYCKNRPNVFQSCDVNYVFAQIRDSNIFLNNYSSCYEVSKYE